MNLKGKSFLKLLDFSPEEIEGLLNLAAELAEAGDIVLAAGKGHENYQEINGVKHAFDDRQILREIRERRANVK